MCNYTVITRSPPARRPAELPRDTATLSRLGLRRKDAPRGASSRVEVHPDAITPLDDWYRIVKRAEYRTPQDVKNQFGSASFIGGPVTVFNIAGNKYHWW